MIAFSPMACSYLLDQCQPAGVVRPPIEHHAIDGPGFHRRLGLLRHLATELGVVEVEAEVAAFVPSRDDLPLLVPQPPLVSLGQVALVGIPVADFSDEDEVGIECQELLPEGLGPARCSPP